MKEVIKLTLNYVIHIANENEMRRRVTDRLDGLLTHLSKNAKWRDIIMKACSSDSNLSAIGQQLGAFVIRQPHMFPPQGLR